MTDLLDRAVRVSSTSEGRTGSLTFRGVLAAVWAAAMGLTAVLVVVLVAWAADARSGAGAGAMIRTALQAWLLAHHATLSVGGASVGLAPLGLTLVPALLLARGARVVAVETGESGPPGALRVTAAVATPYALLTALVTSAAATAQVRPMPVQALFAGAVVATVAAGVGAVRGTGSWAELTARVPLPARAAAAAGTAAVGVLVAAGAALALLATGVHAGDAQHVLDALQPGFAGWLALLLVALALVPNAVVCGTAYVVGPGFAVGAGTAVGPLSTHVGTLPALPSLAALPRATPPWPVLGVVVVVVVGAGMLAGTLLARRLPQETPARLALLGLAAGAVAGVVVAVLATVAGGPVGPGALATVGASPWKTGLVAAGEVAVLAGATAAALAWRRG